MHHAMVQSYTVHRQSVCWYKNVGGDPLALYRCSGKKKGVEARKRIWTIYSRFYVNGIRMLSKL